MPLQFNRNKQQILLKNGTRIDIPGTFIDDPNIVEPKGSTWAMVSTESAMQILPCNVGDTFAVGFGFGFGFS